MNCPGYPGFHHPPKNIQAGGLSTLNRWTGVWVQGVQAEAVNEDKWMNKLVICQTSVLVPQ